MRRTSHLIGRLASDERGGGSLLESLGRTALVMSIALVASALGARISHRLTGRSDEAARISRIPSQPTSFAATSFTVERSMCAEGFLPGAIRAFWASDGQIVGDMLGTTDAELKRRFWDQGPASGVGELVRASANAAPAVLAATPMLLQTLGMRALAWLGEGSMPNRAVALSRGVIDFFVLDPLRTASRLTMNAWHGGSALFTAAREGDCVAFGRTLRDGVNDAPETTLALLEIAPIGGGFIKRGRRPSVALAKTVRAATLDPRRVKALAAGVFCFAAGTEVHTVDGLAPIEKVQLGDRVVTLDSGEVEASAVDASWRRVNLELEDPRRAGARIHVALLRPNAWLLETNAYVGAHVPVVLEEMGIRAYGRVVSIDDAPRIVAGVGRVVLGTVESESSDVLVLAFRGSDEILEPTAGHRLYSLDRQGWVKTGDLRIGERLRSKHGEAIVSAIERKPGVHTVYNLEVETDHTYLTSKLGIQSHNDCAQPFRSGAAALRHAEAEALVARVGFRGTSREQLARAEQLASELVDAYSRALGYEPNPQRLVQMSRLLRSEAFERDVAKLSSVQRAFVLDALAREAARWSVQEGADSAADVLRRAWKQLAPAESAKLKFPIMQGTSLRTLHDESGNASHRILEYARVSYGDRLSVDVRRSLADSRFLLAHPLMADALSQLDELDRALFFDTFAYVAARAQPSEARAARAFAAARDVVAEEYWDALDTAFTRVRGHTKAWDVPTDERTVEVGRFVTRPGDFPKKSIVDLRPPAPGWRDEVLDLVAAIPVVGQPLARRLRSSDSVFKIEGHIDNVIVFMRDAARHADDARRKGGYDTLGVSGTRVSHASRMAVSARSSAADGVALLEQNATQSALMTLSFDDRASVLNKLVQVTSYAPFEGGMRGLLERGTRDLEPKTHARFFGQYERVMLDELRSSGRLLGARAPSRSWPNEALDALFAAPIVGPFLANTRFGRSVLVQREIADAERLLGASIGDETLRNAVTLAQRRILEGQELRFALEAIPSRYDRVSFLLALTDVTGASPGSMSALFAATNELWSGNRRLFFDAYEGAILNRRAYETTLLRGHPPNP